MDENTMKKLLETMEIPVTVEIPNAVIISKDLMKKSLAVIGGYVVAKKFLYIYAKAYMAQKEREK